MSKEYRSLAISKAGTALPLASDKFLGRAYASPKPYFSLIYHFLPLLVKPLDVLCSGC
jgi:hypothetical protein